MSCIIYPNDEGGIALVIPSFAARREVLVAPAVYAPEVVEATDETPEHVVPRLVTPEVYAPESDETFLAWIAEKDIPPALDGSRRPFRILNEVPEDPHGFFGAWEWNDGEIRVSIEKAKEIQRAKWQAAGAKRLKDLSEQYLSALLSQDAARQTEIASEVQAVRDVINTPLPDDIGGIAATWPAALTKQTNEISPS